MSALPATSVIPAARKPTIGLVLGSGSARGWAHIGVIRALAEAGIVPDIVCGCSIGAFVGAVYADGDIEKLESWVSALTWKDVVSLLDMSLTSGLIKGEKLIQFFERHFVNRDFHDLGLPFAVVATDLATGRERWLREGNVAQAVRASIAIPGLFTPVAYENGYLVDGGLVNPIPVSLCRALGADVVIAVDLCADVVGSALKQPVIEEESEAGWTRRILARFGKTPAEGETARLPSLVSVVATGIHIMQVRIARSRLAGEPADVLIAPRLARIGPLDYHRGVEAIAEGRAAVERMRHVIEAMPGLKNGNGSGNGNGAA
ncbi:MAG: patatin-like phospholipase RssA [Zoogloeaceae bacterium]|jgi:NTE family protein|nr:patatin-like phospholipase RssA [Zoogloeaceae bacterium]